MGERKVSIDAFIAEDVFLGSSGLRSFDYEKINALPDDRFAQLYLALMEQYRDNDGWWSTDRKTPHCSRCRETIDSPRQLRRYYGNSLHPQCFRERLQEDEDRGMADGSKEMKQYWGRVAKLDLERT